MANPENILSRLRLSYWLALGMFVLIIATFIVYVRAEKQIDHFNELRHQSFVLSDELRQSCDDLTRMAHAYVLTGNTLYKRRHQEILDIRDGRKSRPVDYHNNYWNPALVDDTRRPLSGPAIPLLELMRQAGLSEKEFAKLAEAKANSDLLARREFAAMKLIESANPPTEANRDKAIRMLFDADYYQDNANSMIPISQFNRMMDQRTLQLVRDAEANADRLRMALILFGLLLVALLWNSWRSLHAILGGPVDELHRRIAQLGGGDFSSAIPVTAGMGNSVLGWVAEMQIRLARLNEQRRDVEAVNQRMTRLYAALSQCNQAIVRCTSEAELFMEVCRVAVTSGGMKLAWIGVLDEQGKQIKPIASFGEGSKSLEGVRFSVEADSPLGRGTSARAIREDRPIWCQDLRQDPAIASLQERTARFGWIASASLPLHRNGVVAGIFTMCTDAAGAFDDKARDLLVEMASDIDFALQNFERDAQRQQAESELRKSEQRLQTILKTASDGIHIMDSNGLLIDANNAFLNMLGYDDSAIGKLRVTDWAQDPWAVTKSRIDSLLAQRSRAIIETRHRRRDGTILDVEISATAIEIDGQSYIYAASRDISERKRLDNALRESEARFRTLTEDAPEAILIHDLESGLFVDATSSAERLFACSRDEILRHGPLYFYSPNQPTGAPSFESIKERGARILAGEQMKFERLVRNCKGEEIICEVRLVRLPSATKKLVRVSYIDISERKLAERELRVAAIAFESQQGMFISDAAGKILRVNQAFTDITGYSAEETVGQHPGFLRADHHNEANYAEITESLRDHGYWQGESWNRRKNGEIFPDWVTISVVKDDAGKVLNYVSMMTDISQRKAAEEKIQHLVFYDPLTLLPNRRLLSDRLHQALTSSARHHRHGALMLLDLDNFKALNDTLGHDAGDSFLLEIGRRLPACVREGDTVARQGGDEFAVIVEDLSEDALAAMQAESVAMKILQAIAQPHLIDVNSGGTQRRQNHHSTASIGIALFFGNTIPADELMRRADLAMYQAKAAGRNSLRFYDPEMQATATARATLEADLHQGLQQNQFRLYYQPQVDEAGRTIGAEALVRWQHPLRGLVSPAHFIPIAEETGLILPLGNWVLETACAQLARWAEQPETAHLTLAVNVSARQFHHSGFEDQVFAALDESGADPKKLKLELTESLLLDDVEDTIAKMTALKAKGVGFVLDDFGTGYSSLSYLKRLPLELLKIDRAFVQNILTDSNDAAIALMIVALAQSMGLGVIAEGVETKEQMEFLAHMGCHAFQGYLFSRPLPIEDFEKL